MGSTRLPGKMMENLVAGKSTLEVVVERLRRTTIPEQVVVATSEQSQDDVIAEEAARLGVECFRGPEDDVLGRIVAAGRAYEADVICETTGDCPLHDPEVIDQVVACYRDNPDVDYVSNVLSRRWPHGLDVEVFGHEVIESVAAATDDPKHREHVTTYIRENPDQFGVFNVSPPPSLEAPGLRVTLDYEEDLELIRAVLDRIYDGGEFDAHDIVEVLEANPELREINANRVEFGSA